MVLPTTPAAGAANGRCGRTSTCRALDKKHNERMTKNLILPEVITRLIPPTKEKMEQARNREE